MYMKVHVPNLELTLHPVTLPTQNTLQGASYLFVSHWPLMGLLENRGQFNF